MEREAKAVTSRAAMAREGEVATTSRAVHVREARATMAMAGIEGKQRVVMPRAVMGGRQPRAVMEGRQR